MQRTQPRAQCTPSSGARTSETGQQDAQTSSGLARERHPMVEKDAQPLGRWAPALGYHANMLGYYGNIQLINIAPKITVYQSYKIFTIIPFQKFDTESHRGYQITS